MLAKNNWYNLCVIDKVLPQTSTNIVFFLAKLYLGDHTFVQTIHSQNGARPPMHAPNSTLQVKTAPIQT